MRFLPLMLGLLAAPSAWAFECAEPVQPATLEQALADAEQAFADLDDVGFRDKVNEIAGLLLPCVSRALPAPLVARYHRVMALHLFAIGDEAGAFAALDAAKLADPEFAFDGTLLPENHALREHYAASTPDDSTRKVPEPRAGSIAFDGVVERRRPKSLPTLVQLFDEQGLAQSTSYLAPREPLPPYRAIPRQRTTLILSSAGSFVVASTLYGLAWAQRSNLFATAQKIPPPPPAVDPVTADLLDAKRNRTNALTIGSTAFLGISIGTAIGAAVIGER